MQREMRNKSTRGSALAATALAAPCALAAPPLLQPYSSPTPLPQYLCLLATGIVAKKREAHRHERGERGIREAESGMREASLTEPSGMRASAYWPWSMRERGCL